MKKRNFIKIAGISILGLMLNGCTTIENWFQKIDENQLAIICSATEFAANSATVAAIKNAGEDVRLPLLITTEVITAAIDAQNYEPELLTSLIETKLQNTPYSNIALSGLNLVLDTYKSFYTKNWNNTEGAQLVCYQFLMSLNKGIISGLTATDINKIEELSGSSKLIDIKNLQVIY